MTTATANPVRSGVQIRQTQLLIDGKFVDSQSGMTFATIDPSTEQTIADVAEGDRQDIDLAVRAARRAFDDGPWRKMDSRQRGTLLYKLADLMDDNAEELAILETLDNGKPITDSRSWDIPGAAATIRYYAGWADKIHGKTIPISGPYHTFTKREPVGVCGQIIPWNFPLCMLAWKWGPALAMGCTVVLKPAEQTPLTALRMGELAMEAGFPPGVINIVPGFGPTAGAALVEHPMVDKIAFTGETSTGRTILKAAADTMKRVTVECGGKSPNVVFSDCEMEDAVDGAYQAIFLNQGQNCCAGSRAMVHASVYDRFVEQLAERAASRRLGDPFDERTEQGPQVDRNQFDKIMRYCDAGGREGARIVTGGKRAFERGYFVKPTVFADVEDEMTICTDEIFGPVVCVQRFSHMDELIDRANQSNFGLAAAIWTRDIDKAHWFADNIQAGTVWVNCYNVVDCVAPFGGFKQSGIGRELGEAALSNYTEAKTVTIRKSQP